MENVLVTGGGGFIGGALVRELVARKVRVTVVGRNSYPELENIGVQGVRGDIRDRECLDLATKDKDVVFHVAAKAGIWGSRQEYFSINYTGTENILNSCRENKVKGLVYTSTPSVVFDRQSIENGNETLPYAEHPLCHYAASKIAAEKIVLKADSSDFRTAAIRPHLVWGPGDRHLIPRLLERGRQKQLKIVGSGMNKVDISYIDNVVHAHLLAAKNLLKNGSAGGQAFFIGQSEPVVLWDWVNDLFSKTGVSQVRKAVPFKAAYIVGAICEGLYTVLGRKDEPRMTRFLAHQLADSHYFSHSKAIDLLGYKEEVSTEEGAERLIRWLGKPL